MSEWVHQVNHEIRWDYALLALAALYVTYQFTSEADAGTLQDASGLLKELVG